MMTSTNELRKAIEHTTRQFIDAYKEAGEKNDPSLINRDVDETCTREILPKSLLEFFGAPPDWASDNKAYEEATANDIKVGVVKQATISNLTIDTEAHKAAATTVAEMGLKDGGIIILEHAWILDFNEDGSKIVKVVEFCDQDAVRRFAGLVYPNGLEVK
ncbi:hypothetical protein FSARC_12854 [Fusarium sarcochroum]|uniref:Uncharacterized protein n=1 Tax=Fusarium sarcochroum TaxID=1208366 RepID=A0A8H4T5L2_9HYPO|nr:hypothetical protein FSARC_12854 [Fusarium sarcochroum]